MKYIACLILTLALAFGQASAEVELKAAAHKEEVQGDLKGAIEAYRKIVSKHAQNRPVAAQALLRMAGCREKLGDSEARKIYEQIVKGYSDQLAIAAQARAKLGAARGAAARIATRRVEPLKPGCLRPGDGARWQGCVVAGALILTESATGKEFRVPGPAPREGFTPGQSSPDGSRYAYAAPSSGGATSLYVVQPGVSEPRNLGVVTAFLGWSPDSRSLLVATAAPALIIVNGSDGTRRELGARLKSGANTAARFSPDGRFIVYEDTDWFTPGDLRILDTRTGADEVLVQGDNPKLVGWHNEGWLLYTARPSGPRDLFRVRLRDGKPLGTAEAVYRDLDVRLIWMNAEGAVFYMLPGNASDVFQATLNDAGDAFTAAPAVVSTQYRNGTRFGAYSRDGKWLAYDTGWRGVAKIVVRKLDGGTAKERISPFVRIQSLQWYPDGSALLVHGSTTATGQPGFHRFDLATGGVTPVLEGGAVRNDLATNPTFSPDGRYLYFKSWEPATAAGAKEQAYLARLELATGQVTSAFRPMQPGQLRNFSFSPDMRQIVFGFHEGKRYAYATVPAEGGEPRVIFECTGEEWTRGYSALAFTGDGRGIVVHKVVKHAPTADAPHADEDELWYVPLQAGGAPTRLHNTGGWTLSVAGRPGTRELSWQAARVRPPEFWVMENVTAPLGSATR